MSAKPHLLASGTISSDLIQALIAGRGHDAATWYDYVDRFHSALPRANETLFENLRTAQGHSSYGVLARAAARAGGNALLDAGCGDGSLFYELLDVSPEEARFTGIDLCATEVERGRADFEREPRVRFEIGRLEALPFDDATFDAVVSHQVLNFLPDPLPTLREMYRVLRPGGIFTFVVNARMRAPSPFASIYRAARESIGIRYPHLKEAVVDDPRIYEDVGILELLRETGPFDVARASLTQFTVAAMMDPVAAASIYSRMYVYGSLIDEAAFEAAEARARELAEEEGRELVDIFLNFRLVQVRKPLLAVVPRRAENVAPW